jgi:8-oxo-dGTP pyrophosphatase MutT (NUDIX family)
MIKEVEAKYGFPEELAMQLKTTFKEFRSIRESQKEGRSHDLTFFIFKGEELIFIAKHWYPPGMYRAPSGGLHPGESFEEGAKREIYEETGVEVKIEKYLLRINATFTCGDDRIDWKTHIFKIKHLYGEPHPVDTKEIREVRLVKISDIPQIKRIMLSLCSTGLRYRARLTDEVLKLLQAES